ncbi:DegV family protein [Clostridium cellulovorans]|uniref:DegV family protein n=1 Tax=Clostridium cellulovorans (strain ATCC 35296 / DSM 3052 / OCM 3 / 743B) TaxID=573061 RepID=D9SR78_CLOC7|nr:DegV family protein [Clostridium cellulovorans]ADL50366.1 degV family protein [Clostridium cellulovorans 743B]
MKTILITDSCCDLPLEYIRSSNIQLLKLSVFLKGQEFFDDLGETFDSKAFYDKMRSGETATTSQINVNCFLEEFEKWIDDGYHVIYIGFSSSLSGCINSSIIAKNMILEDNPEANIEIIDTKAASLGEGLLVYYASEMLKTGASSSEIVKWINDTIPKVNHWFTVDDLNHLKRGGRVSSTAATIGTLLNIKPILHVDDDGKLIPISKVQGRKKSIRFLHEKLKEKIINSSIQTIFISHGDCIEDAEMLKALILKDHKVKNVIINPISAAVGAHSGPGTVALFFIGDNRS